MKVLILSGSRNPAGRTARAIDALVEGASSAGCDTETLFLSTMQIERCRQCDEDGWGLCREGKECVIEDDFAEIVEKVRAADLLVIANPVYYGSLSESVRAFLDRLRRICTFGASKDRIKDKPAVAVCVAGGGGGGAPRCTVDLEYALFTCGFDVVDVVPARRQNLDMKLDVLRTVGKWLATNPKSS